MKLAVRALRLEMLNVELKRQLARSQHALTRLRSPAH